jgi:hypothetical protein
VFIIGLGACFSGLGGGSTRPLRSDSLAGAFRDGLCALCMVAEASHQEQVCLQLFCKYGMLRKGVQVIGSLGQVQASGGLRLAGAGALASESQHMGATRAGARDATRRLFARTLSWSEAINVRSETRLAVTGAITPLTDTQDTGRREMGRVGKE